VTLAAIVNKRLIAGLQNQKGFTLVELIIALSMSAIVMTGLHVIVSNSYEYIISARKKIRLQQDYSLIDLVLASNIRQATGNQQEIYADYADYLASQPPEDSGSCMILFFPSGDSILIYRENDDFTVEQTGGTVTNLVQDVLDTLVFVDGNRSIETRLAMSNGNYMMADTLLHAFRNFAAAVVPDTLRPMGVGSWSNNSPAGDSPEWACVEEVTPDGDITYVYPSPEQDWRTDTYATDNGSGMGTVDSVVITIRTRGRDSNNQTRTVVLLSGTHYYGSIINLGLSSYTDYSTTYTTNPATSSPWT
jgi:prepilin-type N-terminal cleavage/methylation domain-containing protein